MRTQKGLLLTCDVGVKEYLVWLERSGAIASFILKEIDDHHLFVASRPHLFEELQEYLDAWHDANSFSATQHAQATAATQQSMSHLPPAAQRNPRLP